MKKPPLKITATELSICQRCPRLLAYHGKCDKNVWLTGITGSGVSYGKLFHDHIAGKFHEDAANAGSVCRRELAEVFRHGASELEGRLGEFIKARYFAPFLAEKSSAMQSDQLMAIAKGTEFWAKCLSEFLSGIPSLFSAASKTENMSAVFHRPENILRASYPYKNPGDDKITLEVSGKYDCLLFNPDNSEAALFEFKGFKSADVTVELSQTLIYAWLIFASSGIVPSVNLIYLEDGAPFYFSAADVKKMLNNLPNLFDTARSVLDNRLPLPKSSDPALCAKCRYAGAGAEKCEADWGGDTRGKLTGSQADAERDKNIADESGRQMKRLIDALRELRVFVTGEGFIDGPSFIRLKLKPESGKGATVRKIESTAKDLQVALNLPTPPLIQAQSGYVSVDMPKENRRILLIEDLLKPKSSSLKSGALKDSSLKGGAPKDSLLRPESEAAFPLGLSIDGSVFWVNLENPAMTSILIGGTSGSGKSELLRSIVVGSLLCAPSGGLSFTLIDPKRVTFSDMKNLRSLEEGAVLCDADDAMEALKAAVDEMERRYVLMESAGVQSIAEYNKINEARMIRRVLIIDEFADMTADKQFRADLENFVQRVCQKGRAAGIHLILATQRPDTKAVTPLIKANLQLRAALKVTSQKNSEIILGEGFVQAQCLLGNGDMIAGGSVAPQRLQAPLSSISLLGAEYWNSGNKISDGLPSGRHISI